MMHIRQTNLFRGIWAVGAVAAVGLLPVSTAKAAGYALETLHSFCSKGGDRCLDGAGADGLIIDSSGNLFGTAGGGGKYGDGVAFELTPNGPSWTYNVIHNFCSNNNCADGAAPANGSLIMDTSGNLYGITDWVGSRGGDGKVFELSYSVGDQKWIETVFYAFQGGNDGNFPLGGLTYAGAGSGAPYDGVSPLYGEANYGGRHGTGNIYELTPPDSGKRQLWKIRDLYDFCSKANCRDGGFSNPAPRFDGPLAMDGQGNLYGTTNTGGTKDSGVAFELSAAGEYTVLYNFCSAGGKDCTDGSHPHANVIIDAAGNLFGTTRDNGQYNGGTLFKLIPNGAASQFSKLYDFCQAHDAIDGCNPYGRLLMDSSGNLYGTTSNWGKYDQFGGVVFKYSTAGEYDVLYSFCKRGGCKDGNSPVEGVVMDSSGNLFGTTESGGKKGSGTVFSLSPR